MACINMFNSERQGLYGAPPPMSPRISFSYDFVVDHSSSSAAAAAKHAAAPPDPNFEFSVGSRPMMAADELFFKGRMLPLRGNRDGSCYGSGRGATTLRDELRAPEDDDPWDAARTPKGSATRWRQLLGLKRPQCSKKLDKGDGGGGGASDPEAIDASKSSEVGSFVNAPN